MSFISSLSNKRKWSVVCSVMYLHNWPRFSFTQSSVLMSYNFQRIYESVRWLKSWPAVIFNKLDHPDTHLTRPLGQDFLKRTLVALVCRQKSANLLPVRCVEGKRFKLTSRCSWPERKPYQWNFCSPPAMLTATFMNKEHHVSLYPGRRKSISASVTKLSPHLSRLYSSSFVYHCPISPFTTWFSPCFEGKTFGAIEIRELTIGWVK
jgi:hypothetical protein